jgi:uncharacterized protein (TIGR02421 family)
MKNAPLKMVERSFEPKFGPCGELRQKVGDTGRAHVDRWLPFLILNRCGEPETSIARRIAINSPAYLIWSPEDDAAAVAALDALVESIGDRFGTVLLIAVADGPWQRQRKDSAMLPRFTTRTAADGSDAVDCAKDALRKALAQVEIDLRRPEVETMLASEDPFALLPLAHDSRVERLSLIVPQIHRMPDGGLYPQLTHELSLSCTDALLQAAYAFMTAARLEAPPHHRALGRSAFLKAALHADEKLDRIARSFDFLLSISPINTDEARAHFLECGEVNAPRFRYRPLTIDPDVAKRDLYSVDLSILEDPLLERLLCDKRRELDHQLTMLATRNSSDFKAASLLLYGSVGTQLLKDADSILAEIQPAPLKGETIGAHEVAAAAEALIAVYQSADTRFAPTVEVRDDVSGMLVSGGRLMIASSTAMPRHRLDALLSHEVSVHLLTYFNGAVQALTVFRTGLSGYEGVQEGLGVFAEWAVGGLTGSRLRLLAGRVIAVDMMIGGAEFVEVYRRLTRELGFGKRSAFDITARVFRSGGLAKDYIYLKGFRYVLDRIAAGVSLDAFWLGKISPDHVPVIEELLQRKLLHPPSIRPEFLSRPDAKRRIAALAPGLPLHRTLDME